VLKDLPLYGNAILTAQAQAVGRSVPVSDLVKVMRQAQSTLRHPCVVAKHVGVNVRIIAVETRYDRHATAAEQLTLVLVNPEVVAFTNPLVVGIESDISIPDYQGSVERYSAVRVSYLDEKMQPMEGVFTDIAARWIQHGIEMLDGKLFIDNLNDHRKRSIKSHLKRITDNGLQKLEK
jgi:peptide deformylase